MFGPIMRFTVGELEIELAPLRRSDMQLFVRNGGMQNHNVTKFLGRRTAPTIEDENEWFDRTRADSSTLIWGIYVLDGKSKKLIGNTGLHNLGQGMINYAVTGCMIFRPEYWGKGIASTCHRVRTWYAFSQMQPPIVQLRSAVMDGNEASQKALEAVGYVPVFFERNEGFVDGKFVGKLSLDCINPQRPMWDYWWHGDPVSDAYNKAHQQTKVAMQWAEEHVSFG